MHLSIGMDGTLHLRHFSENEQAVCGAIDLVVSKPVADWDQLLGSPQLCRYCREFMDVVEIGDDEVWLHPR